ncbi:hypothetical protein GPJ56_008714 [Histomonas meleagridis]|uniref:uncharacterized protein n=1 Tax=Histomonas meleagridis TaxID=135588 RepID=UPI0035594376|nr:hypothetical protein GPJ56_008714 [Histomonas meleagridis]KAH0803291.1 hypothetical protein GO595_004027 [Histomonas meleagridis]
MNAMYKIYQPTPPKQYPPSSIPPRGWRPLRNPISLPQNNTEKTPSSPVLNEMLTFEPHLPVVEQLRAAAEKNLIKNQLAIEHQERIDFFKAIVTPPDTLEIPSDPVIEQMQPISIHCDPLTQEFTGTMFSVKETEPTQPTSDVQEDEVVSMRLIKNPNQM